MTTKVKGTEGVEFPDASVQATAADAGPAFHAWQGDVQSELPLETSIKINFTTEIYDTNNNYDPSTSRFTPTVAGYYLIIGGFSVNDSLTTNLYLASIFKNGSQLIGGQPSAGGPGAYAVPKVSGIVYLNGSTDYVEIYGYSANKASWSTVADQVFRSCFQAALVRRA